MIGWSLFLGWIANWMVGDRAFFETPDQWFTKGYQSAIAADIVQFSCNIEFDPKNKDCFSDPSRYEAALMYLAIASSYSDQTESYLASVQGLRTEKTFAKVRADRRKLLAWGNHDRFFRRGNAEFYAVLKKLEVSVDPGRLERLRRRVQAVEPIYNARQTPFPDVPKDHWAAEAIRELRAAGLIDGYPGNRFGG